MIPRKPFISQQPVCLWFHESIGSDSRNIPSPANAWFPLFYQRFWWFPGNRSPSSNRSFCRGHQMGIMQNCSCETFIFPRVFNISSWKRDLLHKTSTAHGRSTGTAHCLGNAGFACFPTVFEETWETVHHSGNRSPAAIGARAGNTRNFHCFCTFPEGRPDAPGVHRNCSPQYVWAQLICTHMCAPHARQVPLSRELVSVDFCLVVQRVRK